jgi:hypothetical protein
MRHYFQCVELHPEKRRPRGPASVLLIQHGPDSIEAVEVPSEACRRDYMRLVWPGFRQQGARLLATVTIPQWANTAATAPAAKPTLRLREMVLAAVVPAALSRSRSVPVSCSGCWVPPGGRCSWGRTEFSTGNTQQHETHEPTRRY